MRLVAILSAFVLLFSTAPAIAQTSSFQIGGHYSALAFDYPDQTRSGAGVFFVYSPTPWLGFDVSTTVFGSEPIGGGAWQLLAGPRVGGSVGPVNVYGRVRPGFIRFADRFYAPDIVCIAVFPPPESCLAGRTNFNLDLGATVEVPAGERALLRFDVGDTLTRYEAGVSGSSWKQSLQLTAGVGWRF